MAGRILGAGDIVALVERASAELDQAKVERMGRKLAKGQFDLDDLADQLQQMKRMGGVGGIMGMLPGVRNMKKQLETSGMGGEAGDRMFARQGAIISSMTPTERKKPDLLNASRKRRVAKGAGVDVAEINRLLKQHRQMADMFKAMSKNGGQGMMKMAAAMGGMGGGMGGGGGLPGLPKGFTPPGGMGGAAGGADMARLKALGGGRLPAAPAEGGAPGGFDLSKLGGLAGLAGGSPFKKK